MHQGLGEDERRGRRLRGRASRAVRYVVVLALVAGAGYWLGRDRSHGRIAGLDATAAALSQDNARLRRELGEAKRTGADAEARARDFEERYARDIPSGTVRELAALVNDKLGAGVKAERLAFVIRSAQDAPDCDGQAVTRRFIVQTPLYKGPNSAVSFADNTITVTGQGVSTVSAEGKPEAWFDPAQPITVRVTRIGGEAVDVYGKLPIHHSIVVGEVEHRFTVIQGERGFVKVVGDRCRYP